MMLQRLIHSARVNVFESARFYYGLLWVLIGYSIVREVIQKFTLVYHTEPYIFPREIVGVLFFIFITFSIISAWFLRKKIDKNIFIFVATISIISLINEIRYALETNEYSLNDSLTTGQLYYVAKIIFPLLFLGFWSKIDYNFFYSFKFYLKLRFLLIINCLLIIIGVLVEVELFKSYPLSGRWGFSGVFWHRVTLNILLGVYLILTWKIKDKLSRLLTALFSICILLTGQKAGFLYFLLFILIVIIQKKGVRKIAFSVVVLALIFGSNCINFLVSYSTFWRTVYDENGYWGTLFSLRNNLARSGFESLYQGWNLSDWLFGGIYRFPTRAEMMPFDLLFYFGFFGVTISVWSLFKWKPSWKMSIPLIVACFAGGLHDESLRIIIYGMTLGSFKKISFYNG